jgi:hypothetical protein
MSDFCLRVAAIVCVGFTGFLLPANASTTFVEMTTSNGIVPADGVSYTIGIVGDNGGPRNIFPSASSDNNVWTWTGGFPEFLSFGEAETLTVTFGSPVPIADFVFGVNSTSASTDQLTVSGGTAGVGDFNLTDSLQIYTGATGAAVYNSATGTVTAAGQNQSLMIGSTSSNTVTSLSFAAGASDGGADGYTVFFGLATPEPGTAGLLLGGLIFLCGGRSLRRRLRTK